MKIYHYHPLYKHLLGEGVAESSPIGPPDVWLIPAHATEVEPPISSSGRIPVLQGDSWKVIKDRRGIYYNTLNPAQTIQNFNPSKAPDGFTKEIPPEVPPEKELAWEGEWVLKDVEVKPLLEVTLTPYEKLEKLGLTSDDLKEILGLS
jgi:hypothetical protein